MDYAHAPGEALERVVAHGFIWMIQTKTMVRCACCAHQSGVLTDEEVLRLAEKISGVECLVAQEGSLS